MDVDFVAKRSINAEVEYNKYSKRGSGFSGQRIKYWLGDRTEPYRVRSVPRPHRHSNCILTLAVSILINSAVVVDTRALRTVARHGTVRHGR